jgi:hypothetical protein
MKIFIKEFIATIIAMAAFITVTLAVAEMMAGAISFLFWE